MLLLTALESIPLNAVRMKPISILYTLLGTDRELVFQSVLTQNIYLR